MTKKKTIKPTVANAALKKEPSVEEMLKVVNKRFFDWRLDDD